MGISDHIAEFIRQTLQEKGGLIELSRGELANMFGCVPSQINYVLATRFTPEHGYVTESRRGGGGYIRITRVLPDSGNLLMHTVNSIGDSLDTRSAAAFLSNLLDAGVLDEKQVRLIASAIGDGALRPATPEARDILRASILKNILIQIQ